jgi:hypothetical protein
MKKLLAGTAIGLVGIIGASTAQVHSVHFDVVTKPNSCSIHCPANSAFPSMSGSVGCTDGTTPVCQCGDPKERMASCEALTQ